MSGLASISALALHDQRGDGVGRLRFGDRHESHIFGFAPGQCGGTRDTAVDRAQRRKVGIVQMDGGSHARCYTDEG